MSHSNAPLTVWLLMVVALCLGAVSCAAPRAGMTLVAGGEAKAVIVTAVRPSPAASHAALILSEHLRQMSGAQVPVVSEADLGAVTVGVGGEVVASGPIPGATLVLVGESDLAARLGVTAEGLGAGGIRIKTLPNALVLLGPDDATPADRYGTRHAVTTFLEDELGCRYLWPGESGKIVPATQTIRVGNRDLTYTPPIRQRRIRWLAHHDRLQAGLDKLGFTKEDYLQAMATGTATVARSGGYFGWHRLGGSLGLVSGHAFGHMWEKYSADHPEWFALQANGSRDQSDLSPHRSRLCVSNTDLIEAIAQEKIAALRAAPLTTSVSVGPNDGGLAAFCTCVECEKLDAPEGRMITLWDNTGPTRRYFEHVSLTDRYVFFWNGIAERVCSVFPDAVLTADAYSVYAAPPVHRKLHPNIAIRYVGISYMSDEARRRGRADWDAWARAASRIYWRPNLLLAGRREGTPALFPHKLAEDTRYMARHSLVGTDFDSCVHNWATQGLNTYVLAKLLWRPDLDVDDLIEDYCRMGFGAAWKDIRRYLARLEALTDRKAARNLGITEPFTPAVIDELYALLDAAGEKVTGDAAVVRRLHFLRRGLEFTDLQAESYRMLAEKGDGPLTPELRTRAGEVLNRKWALAREILKEEPLAVNVGYVYWGGEGRFGRLGWTWPKPSEMAQ